jgi:hypothetical protein
LVPAYVVQFTQREAVELAGKLTVPLGDAGRSEELRQAVADFKFGPGFGQTLSKLLKKGIGVHHAGMLPRYRRLVEKLAGEGLLSVISGTDTLGIGINMPIKTVVLTSLVKYDGRRLRRLNAREFHQIAGRAGRAGYDAAGHVIAQAPPLAIAAAKANAKAAARVEAGARVTAKRPKAATKTAAKGQVSWSEATFNNLVAAQVERLTPRLRVTPTMVLELLHRPDPITAAYDLLTDNHQPPRPRNQLIREACRIYHSLRVGGVVRHAPGRLTLATELPPNFALSGPLTPFALAAAELLDPDSAEYAVDVLSIFEATLEAPRQILLAQEDAAKKEALARMKAEGWDYLERMNALDKITHPQPLAQFLAAAMTTYSAGQPWVKQFDLVPKSIVRYMWERSQTFAEFVSTFGLGRSEGLLLRYLTDAYRTLERSTPPDLRVAIWHITAWLGNLVRNVDSSLIDEWEALDALAEHD